jgi:molybdopterin synthase sulfur carrier subunit
MNERPINILYFAWLRERVGRAHEAFELPGDVSDVAGLVTWLRAQGRNYENAFAIPGVVRCAVNQVFASPDTLVQPGDEVAFFPPVTGG